MKFFVGVFLLSFSLSSLPVVAASPADEARFAVKLEALRVRATDGYTYGTALKLIGSSISIEPSQTFFVSSLYATIDAARNLGVRANKTGTQLENLLPNGKVADTYYFCTDGIYYGDAKILST